MAHYLRMPVAPPPIAPFFRCPSHLRPYSFKAGRFRGQPSRQPTEQSVKVAAKELGKLPSDLGLLAHTFIHPTGANRPSLFRKPGAILKLQWIWLKRRVQGILALWVYKFSNKPRLKLQLRQTAAAAVGLHRQMYTAFAAGDVRLLDLICADGLRERFRERTVARPPGERWKWELIRYNKRAKVVSNRAASLGIDGMGLRQHVVRICSRQILTRYRPNGTVVPGSGAEFDATEYLVIQKRLENFAEQDWMVWGTTGETTLEELESEGVVESHEASG